MRCGICGSERLSPVGELTSGEKWQERLRLRFPRQGLFKARPTFDASYGRACLDCGTVFPILGRFHLQELNATADELTDGAGDAPSDG